jgi:hypothetical protein
MVVGGAAIVLLGSAGAGVAHAGGSFLGLNPDNGKPGTPYKVTITCDQKPTLYGSPLDDNPPGTIVPLVIAPDGATQWTYDATAGQYDEQYGASCGDVQEQARFDADAPHLLLGPVATNFGQTRNPKTEVLGSDCPAGTTASVTITLDGTTTTHTATIDERGDWAVPLSSPYIVYPPTQSLRAEASCGDVTYAPLVRSAAGPRPTTPQTALAPPTTSTTRTATTPPPAPAPAAQPRRTQSAYTG